MLHSQCICVTKHHTVAQQPLGRLVRPTSCCVGLESEIGILVLVRGMRGFPDLYLVGSHFRCLFPDEDPE